MKFNETENLETKEHLMDKARKILFRCKRRLGLNSLGVGSHVDLPAAWTEAIYLAQCKGEIQEEALNMLCTSLDHAPLSCSHLATIIFIAESVLYRICCDASQKSYLYSSEIKLIKIGFLIFLRLFVYHLYGYLDGFEAQLIRLQPHLYALYFCDITYSKFPNIHSSLGFIQKTGEVICTPEKLSEAHSDPVAKKELNIPGTRYKLKPYKKRQEVSHLLWHCTVVWSCVQNQRPRLNEVLEHLLKHKEQLQKKFWLDSVLGLFILGDAAKINISCLKTLMKLGKDFISRCMSPQNQEEKKDSDSPWEWNLAFIYITILGDICLHATTSSLRKTAFMGYISCEDLSKYLELKNTKSAETVELRAANFLDLLKYFSSQISDNCCQMTWTVYYGLVYNLVKMNRELDGDESQDGLRNLFWKILQRIKVEEKDKRILNAIDIAEAELNNTINPFISSTIKAPRNPSFFRYTGRRLAYALSNLFLPPVSPSSLFIKRRKKEQKQMIYKIPKQYQMDKKVIHIILRKNFPEEIVQTYPDILTRTDVVLRTIVEKQWEKEQQIRLYEEEMQRNEEMKRKRKEELECYQAMMKRREEKIHKKTKPYELPGWNSPADSEFLICGSSSDDLRRENL
ncbi:transmembrane protein 232 isoform X2 [Macrotis lagotis]